MLGLLFALGSFEGCSCEDNSAVIGDGGDLARFVAPFDGDIDAYLATHDGMYPPGFDLSVPIIGTPQADGGILIKNDAGTFLCFITPCQGHVYQCGDCMDNDGDGLVDSQDPDCLGFCQNNEASFFGSIPGQNNAPCKSDCYWDQDTGSGNDDCHWSHSCDPNEANPPPMTMPEIGCTYDVNAHIPGATVPAGQKDCTYLAATQSSTCHNVCGPLTPNGCDCFGCCEDPNRPGKYVYAGSVNTSGVSECTADPAALADPTKCKPCMPVPGCQKACGRCQLCFGKTTLPGDCYGPDGGAPIIVDGGAIIGDMFVASPDLLQPPPQICDPGVQPCGLLGQGPCQPGAYCISGCCASIVIP
jgi:hypothetical protein